MSSSQNNIVVYTKKDCPYCAATKELLMLKNIEFTEVEINSESINRFKDKVLFEEEHLPKIYINDRLIGGYQQLVNLVAIGTLK